VNAPGLTALRAYLSSGQAVAFLGAGASRPLYPLCAHAELDQAEGLDQGWAAKAEALHKRLVPPGLDPDPLATVERLVAEQEAIDEDEGDE
jgi:hypothetical protein